MLVLRLTFKSNVCLVDMALSPRDEAEFKQRSAQKLKVTTDPVERLRLACLSRGAHGIKGLGR